MSSPPTPNPDNKIKIPAGRLFGYSFLILFFELALIRFIPANVQVASYFINLVLIATFLGMGTGLILQLRGMNITGLFAPLILILVAVCQYFSNTLIETPMGGQEFLWSIKITRSENIQKWGTVPVVSILFALTTLVFIPLGAAMGREFEKFSSLIAYSINIAGSLAGLAIFALFSYFSTPPLAWFLAGILCFVLLFHEKKYLLPFLFCFPLTLFLIHQQSAENELWSPYYKINYSKNDLLTTLIVNDSLHQYILNLSPELKHETYTTLAKKDYLRPYKLVKKLDRVLILGAGTGNDVEIALQQNAGHIDAVEIDRQILRLGKELHYQKPYQDPRVTTYVDDARAFLKKTEEKYDLIVMGTLDSQTLLSGMSSVRLDNYVYTLESFQSIKDHLKEGGVLILYHMSPNSVISFKIYSVLTQTFGKPPVMNMQKPHRLFNFTFVAGALSNEVSDFEFSFNLSPAEEKRMNEEIPFPSDDWPYLYLNSPGVPGFYLKLGGTIAVFSLLLVAMALGRKNIGSPDGTLFFLGAGFLLLETKSVTEMSLLFGSTWQVNLLVFSSILAIILIANMMVLKSRTINVNLVFYCLFGSIVLFFLFPVKLLLGVSLIQQWLLGGLLVALPIFFSAITFAVLFKNRSRPVKSLGYNVIGAILGGILEYSAMAYGTKSLYLLSLVMYLLAFLIHLRKPAM